MTPARQISAQRILTLALLAAAYFLAAALGLRLAIVNPSASLVWPPTGIAMAAMLLLGTRVWPAILAGAFFVNLWTAGTIATSLGIATGNTLEAIAGAFLVTRFAGGRHAFTRPRFVLRFALLAAALATTISATIGTTSLALGGFVPRPGYGAVWLTWWLGDAVGALVVTPVVLLWRARPRLEWQQDRTAEALALFLCLLFATQFVFGGAFPSDIKNYPLDFLCIPPLVWAAYRFGPREAASGILLLAIAASWGTVLGFGPFVRSDPNESLILTQAFIGVAAVSTLVLATVVAERTSAEAQLRHLSQTDPLTGLANYRLLMERLQREVIRSERTGRPFSVVLLDVNRMKQINDEHGHVAGSRALCRIATALRASSRAVDTAARYGGDEFVLLMPESDAPAAAELAGRIIDSLARDHGATPVTVSIGAATYPGDGATMEALLEAADRALYRMKNGDATRIRS